MRLLFTLRQAQGPVLLTVFRRAMQRRRITAALLVPRALALSALWVTEPVYGRFAVDELLKIAEGIPVDIPFLLGVWLILYLLINLGQSLGFFLRWEVLNTVLAETRQIYYEHILRLDIAHHVRARGGELMKTVDNAADAAVDLTDQLLIELPASFLTALIFYVISFAVSPLLALIAAGLIPLYLILAGTSAWWTHKHYDKVQRLWVKSLGRGYDAITNIFTVKSSAGELREVENMRRIHEEGIRELRRVNVVWALLEGVGYFMLMRIVLIAAGVILLARGEITLGTLFFFQFSFYRLVVPLEMLQHMLPHWSEKFSKLRLAEEIFQRDMAVKNAPDPRTPARVRGTLEFHDVNFSYGNTEAIHHLSLAIREGEHVAIVGHSGAGKSTIVMLLNRFYDVGDGKITVDGTDTRDFDIHWWRKRVGLVLQENVLFNDSVLENIRYSRPEASDEEVFEAARRSAAHAFIEKLPEGYRTLIGERGIRLSGGERQRVAIARAILKNPAIVVLDEATSALDSVTERTVQEGISELTSGRTSVIIAHRLSTVRAADRIAVLHEGHLLTCAPHEELMKTCDVYKEMVELQSHGMLAE